MISVCFYFQAHQPFRIRELSFFEIGDKPEIFDKNLNKKILAKVAKNSYLPSFGLFSRLINKTAGDFRIGLSLTGILLEQLASSQPECIDSILELVNTKSTELLGETYYHSFASLYSTKEFEDQVIMHKEALKTHFNYIPQVFRNTELVYISDIAKPLEKLGFHSILIEGCDRTLKGKNCNYLYTSAAGKGLKILTRNQDYSRLFTQPGITSSRKRHSRKAEDLVNSLLQETGDIVNIWFDLECIGEHQKASTGIFAFIEDFVLAAIKTGEIKFILPSEAQSIFKPKGSIAVFSPVTWHIKCNDISAWNGNAMQIEAMKYIYGLEQKMKSANDPGLIDSWRKIQSSDHLLYMDTMETPEGRPAQLFSPFNSPHEAYIYLMNALASLELVAGTDS